MDPKEYLDEGKYFEIPTQYYVLIPDFDPSSLKVAQLRGILFDNEVEFPSNAKKKELVHLFHENIGGGAVKPKKKSKARELVILDAPPLKSIEVEDENEDITTSPETAANTSISESAKGKKRKSMYSGLELKFSDSPTKGNVFEIDTDSESEILSPKKRSKTSRASTPQTETKKKAKSPGVKSPMVKSPEATPSKVAPPKANSSDRSRASTPSKPSKAIVTPSKAAKSAVTPVKSALAKSTASPSGTVKLESGSGSKHEHLSESTTGTPFASSRKSPQTVKPKIESPKIVSGSPVSWSPKDVYLAHSLPSFQTATQLSDVSDNATGFDLALKKLKQEDEHFNDTVALLSDISRDTSRHNHSRKDTTDADLAKLLGVDLHSVKPKPKGRRVISPRNPIIIQKKRLAYSETLSENEEEKDNVVSDEDVTDEESEDGNEQSETESELRYEHEERKSESEEEDEHEESGTEDINETDRKKSQINGEKTKSKTQSRSKVLGTHSTKSSFRKSFFWFFLSLLSWTLLAALTLFAYWYREQTFLVGYCGQEIYTTTIPDTPDTPGFLVKAGAYLDEHFRPQCVDCPQHARCFPNLEMGCYDDFVEFAPWYFPYMPVVDPTLKRCIPDTKRAEKIEIMIDVALDLLRARNAHKNCGRLPEDDVSAGIEMNDLHDLLLAMKAPYITLEEFEELWRRSVVELEKEPEIIVRQVTRFLQIYQPITNKEQVGIVDHVGSTIDSNNTVTETETTHKIFRSTSLSHVSLKCQLSNTMVSLVLKFRLTLAIFLLGVVTLLVAKVKYDRYKLHHQQLDTLYREVLSKLQRQARLARESSELPGYIGSIQLRDLILSDETNLARKMRLWEAVSRKVDRNTNVSHQLIEIHGEVMKVWEWISIIE